MSELTIVAPEEAAERLHSVSSTRAYERCPREYLFAYVERRPEPRLSPPSWRYGSVVHYALEAAYRHRLIRGNSVSMRECLPAAVAALHHGWAHEQLRDARSLPATVLLLARVLEDETVAAGDVLDVEGFLARRSPAGVNVGGVPDLVVRVDDQTLEIRDHKVTRWMRTPEELVDDLQLNLYGWMARERWPWARRVIAAHHYPLHHTIVRAQLTDQTMQRAVERVDDVAAISADDVAFTPTPGEQCSWCVFLDLCPEGAASLATA